MILGTKTPVGVLHHTIHFHGGGLLKKQQKNYQSTLPSFRIIETFNSVIETPLHVSIWRHNLTKQRQGYFTAILTFCLIENEELRQGQSNKKPKNYHYMKL